MYFSYRTMFVVFVPIIVISLLYRWNRADIELFKKRLIILLAPELSIQLIVFILAWVITGQIDGMYYDIPVKWWKGTLYFILAIIGFIYPVAYLIYNFWTYRKKKIEHTVNKLFGLDDEDSPWSHVYKKDDKYYYGNELANGFIDGREYKDGKIQICKKKINR